MILFSIIVIIHAAISEKNIKCEFVTLKSLDEKMFNLFELNEQDASFSLCDADPDLQYCNDNRHINLLLNCKYYLENNFNDNLKVVCIDPFIHIYTLYCN